MNYTLNQLEIFLKISQTQNITKAAELLNLSQPAVSIQLKNFQQQFPVPLTEVLGKKLFLTDFGKEVAAMAEEILNKAQAIHYRALEHDGKLVGTLKLGVVSTGSYVIPYFLADFIKKHPAVQLHVEVSNKSGVVQALEKNLIDFALLSIPPENMRLEKIELLKNTLYWVGSPKVFAQGNRIAESDWPSVTVIYRELGSGLRQIAEQYIKERQFQPLKWIELSTYEMVKHALLAGVGISVMPLVGLRQDIASGTLQVFEVENFPITTTWSMVWNTGKMHSPSAKAFLNHIEENKGEIVRQYFF
jgi:DNA-binding transcriptional LysR family regulator